MATSKDAGQYILGKLGNSQLFSLRPMFGEYALYCQGKTVGFICDDTLFVKILPASRALTEICEQGPAYPGSKLFYIVDESQLDSPELSAILVSIAASIPDKKKS